MIYKILHRLWNESPASIYSLVKKKLNFGNNIYWEYGLDTILNDSKHLNINALIDRLERYTRITNLNIPNSTFNLNFESKTIFELGCGPLLGCGPIFLFLGAKRFYYYEPFLLKETVASKEIKERYFNNQQN